MKTNYCECLLWGALLLAGCSDDNPGVAEEEDPGEHACEHAGEAGAALEAAADPADAVELVLGEEPVTVTFPAEGAGYHGYVRLRGPADALLFAGAEAVISSLTSADGGRELLPEAAPNELCPDAIPEHFDLELEDAEYLLELGPATVDSVWLMLLDASGHAHSS
ncbi:MAG TPA: hypothetical protein VM686_09980 [Polyangiaceae bacterium]|nr:hypothetical protein [Polyangiaceae bacterium]